jgi:hypothetical protein
MRVHRLAMFALGMVLLFSSCAVLGQHGGHGGGRGGAPRSPGGGGASDPTMTDFNHALAVRAATGQASLCQALAEFQGQQLSLGKEMGIQAM